MKLTGKSHIIVLSYNLVENNNFTRRFLKKKPVEIKMKYKYKRVKAISPIQRQNLRIYLDIGQNDKHSYLKQNQQFHQELNRLQISNVLNEFPGSHSWRFWRTHLADSLSFVGKQWRGKIGES